MSIINDNTLNLISNETNNFIADLNNKNQKCEGKCNLKIFYDKISSYKISRPNDEEQKYLIIDINSGSNKKSYITYNKIKYDLNKLLLFVPARHTIKTIHKYDMELVFINKNSITDNVVSLSVLINRNDDGEINEGFRSRRSHYKFIKKKRMKQHKAKMLAQQRSRILAQQRGKMSSEQQNTNHVEKYINSSDFLPYLYTKIPDIGLSRTKTGISYDLNKLLPNIKTFFNYLNCTDVSDCNKNIIVFDNSIKVNNALYEKIVISLFGTDDIDTFDDADEIQELYKQSNINPIIENSANQHQYITYVNEPEIQKSNSSLELTAEDNKSIDLKINKEKNMVYYLKYLICPILIIITLFISYKYFKNRLNKNILNTNTKILGNMGINAIHELISSPIK